MNKISRIFTVAKLALGRLCGIKYGGVLFNGTNEVRMVRSSKLAKVRKVLFQKHGAGSSENRNITENVYNSIMTETKGLRRSSQAPAYGQEMCYMNSGALHQMQVYDHSKNEAVITLVDHVKHPIRNFLRLT